MTNAIRKPAFQAGPQLPPLTIQQESLIGYRYGIVQEWRSLCRAYAVAGANKGDATREFLESHPGVKRATLYRWDAFLREDRRGPPSERLGLRVLLDGRMVGVECKRATDDQSSPSWRYFKSVYNAMPPQTVVTCWHLTKAAAEKQGWSWPSLRTVQMRVADPVFQVHSTFFRLGEREWMRRFGHKIERRYEEYRSGEWIMSDFHDCDVFCRRSDSDPRIVRPKISGTLDIRSRKVALVVCLNENQREVLAGLAKWVRANGAPWHWTIDNGKPYRSTGLSGGRPTQKRIENEAYVTSVCGQMDIAVHFSIAFNPNGKANLERFFGTLENQIRPPSWCGHAKDDVFKAAARFAEEHPEKCPTVAEYAAMVDQWVENVYHQESHGGQDMEGLSPNQAFDRFDPVPLSVAPDGVLDQLLMLTHKAKVTSMGVLYKGIHYSNYEGLFNLMGQDVMLRIPAEDAGQVLVCDLETGLPICTASNARLAMTGTTHDHVAEGMKRKARAKRMMKEVRESDPHAALRTVAENAIVARSEEVQRTAVYSVVATGTDNASPSPRNVRPLRSDLMSRLAKSVQSPVEQGPKRKRGSLLEQLADQDKSAVPAAPKRRNILERLND